MRYIQTSLLHSMFLFKRKRNEIYIKNFPSQCDVVRHKIYINSLHILIVVVLTTFYLSLLLYFSPCSYSNDRLVFYNVNCGPNQLIYFELTNISLESTMCLDERVNAGK